MVDIQQFAKYIVNPALNHIGLISYNAVQLVIGTALIESKLTFLRQIDSGPALGFFQMEEATYNDIHDNFLAYKPDLRVKVNQLKTMNNIDGAHPLQHCLLYAAALCRIHYARVKEPLPRYDDLSSMAKYWKDHYNTKDGAGDPQDFMDAAKPVLTLHRG